MAIPLFIEVLEVQNTGQVADLRKSLDLGEAEAIVLAEEQRPDFLLLDDYPARRVAIERGLPVIGLLGVLIKAKRTGLLNSLTPALDDLENVAGFRISAELRAQVLNAVGE